MLFQNLVLAAVMVAGIGGAAGLSAPQPAPKMRAEYAVDSIWYPIHKDTVAQPLARELKRLIAARDWEKSIEAAERMTEILPAERAGARTNIAGEWRIAIAELHLYRGDPEAAVAELEKVFAAIPKPEKRARAKSRTRQAAAYLMARVMAEAGRFDEAVQWEEAAPKEYWSGCGNCLEGEWISSRPMIAVWKRAKHPYPQAVLALKQLRDGGFVPVVAELQPAVRARQLQIKKMKIETALILGELHLRNGETAAARKELQAVAKSDSPLQLLAQAHLERLSSTSQQASLP